jgi:hypothetical protein
MDTTTDACQENQESEKVEAPLCTICLQELVEEHGTLFASVDCPSIHIFHYRCISVWVEQSSQCPLDRSSLSRLFITRHDPSSDVVEREEVVESKQARYEQDWEQQSVCRVCQLGDRDHVLLLCDGCDDMYHTDCVGLTQVPPGDWFCEICQEIQASRPPVPTVQPTQRRSRRSLARQRIHGADQNTIRAARAFAQALRMRTVVESSDTEEYQESSDSLKRTRKRKPQRKELELTNPEFVDNRFSGQSQRKRRFLHSRKAKTSTKQEPRLSRLEELTQWAQAAAEENQRRIAVPIRISIPQVDQAMELEKAKLLESTFSALEPPSSSKSMLAALSQLIVEPSIVSQSVVSQPIDKNGAVWEKTKPRNEAPREDWRRSKSILFEQIIKPKLDNIYKDKLVDKVGFKRLAKETTDISWLQVNASTNMNRKELHVIVSDTIDMLLKTMKLK